MEPIILIIYMMVLTTDAGKILDKVALYGSEKCSSVYFPFTNQYRIHPRTPWKKMV